MKTLDEVIKAYEHCLGIGTDASTCLGCPYANENGEVSCLRHDGCDIDKEDALHYLKAYKDDRNDLTALRAFWAEWKENPPLSWEQLKQMEGKPVWVEGEHGCIWGQKAWSLIRLDPENDDIVICINTDNGVHYEFAIGEEDYGTQWQAYRKER